MYCSGWETPADATAQMEQTIRFCALNYGPAGYASCLDRARFGGDWGPDRGPIRLCDHPLRGNPMGLCGQFFVVPNPKQRYCPSCTDGERAWQHEHSRRKRKSKFRQFFS